MSLENHGPKTLEVLALCEEGQRRQCLSDMCRRKDIKNPRVKNKMRFDKKSKARRGQVQDVREPSAAYGGESTGIKAGVSKSRRF